MLDLIDRDDPIILDVGCNDGEHTEMFLDMFPQAQVFCFEPDIRARQRFRAIVLDSRAHLFAIAVGDFDGSTTFYQSDGYPPEHHNSSWDLSGSIRRPTGHLTLHPWCKFESEITVPLMRLDTWIGLNLPSDRIIDFIWADVQGAEGDLIEGGHQALARTRYFYTEYSNIELYEGQLNLAQLQAMLPGFETVEVFAYDVLFKNKELA
jgi:FkbM family methyltransferase